MKNGLLPWFSSRGVSSILSSSSLVRITVRTADILELIDGNFVGLSDSKRNSWHGKSMMIIIIVMIGPYLEGFQVQSHCNDSIMINARCETAIHANTTEVNLLVPNRNRLHHLEP